ncbi:MAG: CDP-alcohol phosphatidyltransferase family protein, partial [Oricola sp.]|nr:CDP-alcohol phosphatidyltransferase family protein [Oricola sp.]
MANMITLARIALVVPCTFAFLANAPWNLTVALVIFVIAALTDFLDGYVARARGETSALGAALDPVADKLLIAAAFILLVRNGVVHGAGVVAVI